MNPSIQNLETKKWVLEHNIPKDVILRMERLVSFAPRHLFTKSVRTVLRWAYTQALMELKNG